ncbi:FixH family protein [Brevibacillus migulae]|uniref:FixH family protein n=1 Tax=Brevibacillus migulae TaxID=1644114 RepID=UPI001432237A|nr:FixH family protein [Brevibacillus migulae]
MKGMWWTVLLAVCLAIAGCGSEDTASNGPLTLTATEGSYQGKLAVSSAIVGPNTFTWSLTDANNQPVTNGKAVLHFSMEGMDHGKSELALQKEQNGTWTADGPHLMMEGDWKLQVVWTDDQGESHPFDYTLEAKIK